MALPVRRPPRVLLKYYVYMGTTSIGFSLPVWVIFLLSRGITYTEIAALNALFSAIIILGETPTGYVADRIGRRFSLIVSAALISGSVAAFAFADSFLTFAAVYTTWAIGQTFRSGSSDAWLYDVLRERLAESEFARVRGRGNALSLSITSGSAVLAGYLAAVDLTFPFFATAAVTASGIVVLLTFPRSQSTDEDEAEAFGTSNVLPILRDQLLQPSLRWFVAYVALFYAVIEGVSLLVQPVSVDIGAGYVHLGWLYAGFTAVSAVLSYNAGWIKTRVGIKRWFYVVPPVLGLAFVGVRFVAVTAIPAFFLMKAFRSTTPALANQYINDHVESVGRATVLSTAAMAYAVVAMPVELGVGMLSDAFSPLATIAMLGAGLVVGAGAIVLLRSPITTPDSRDGPATRPPQET